MPSAWWAWARSRSGGPPPCDSSGCPRALARSPTPRPCSGRDATRARVAEVAELDHFTGLEAVGHATPRGDPRRRAPSCASGTGSCGRRSTTGCRPATAPARTCAPPARSPRRARRRERTAEHLLQAQRLGEPWALDALREAGRSALAAGRVSSGIAYLRRALDEDPAARSALRAPRRAGRGRGRLGRSGRSGAPGAGRGGRRCRAASGPAPWSGWRSAVAARTGRHRRAGLRARRSTSAEASGDEPQAARLRAGLLLAARFDPELRVRTMERLDPSLREPGFGRARPPALLACVAFERALAGRRAARVAELAERALEPGCWPTSTPCPGPECFAACCALLWADSLATAEIALTMALEAARPARERRSGGRHVRLPRLDRASARPALARGGRRARGERRRGRRPLAGDAQPGHDPGRDRHGAGHGWTRRRSRSTIPPSRPPGRTVRGTPSTSPPAAGSTTCAATTRRPSRSCSRAGAQAGVARGPQPGGASVALARGDGRRRHGQTAPGP